MILPNGVKRVSLKMHHDERGILSEIYRAEWQIGFEPLQWNMVKSQPNVLRGVHLHYNHSDYLLVPHGHMVLYLHDVRPTSTQGKAFKIDLHGDELSGIVIPPGVAHGFYFPVPSMHFYAVSHYWDLKDELACRWNSPELNIEWSISQPLLSAKDAVAGTYQDMVTQFQQKIEEASFV